MSANVAFHLARTAAARPDLAAVIEPDANRGSHAWKRTSYAELADRSRRIAAGLAEAGLARGDRAAVFVRPGADLVAIVYALFSLGASPVIVDPGMGRRAVGRCLASVAPRALIGIPAAHALLGLSRRAVPSIAVRVVVGRSWFGAKPTLARLERSSPRSATPEAVLAADEAAVLFTSGSTGPAKGVVYTHGTFDAQVKALGSLYGFAEGEVDLACFPAFALFGPAFGMTSVFPDMDFLRPSTCDPERIVLAAAEHAATTTFGSPAIWSRVAPWCALRGARLPHLRRVLVAGAPVRPALVEALRTMLVPGADVHTPYGATECLPLASISGADILARRSRAEGGSGSCIGRVAPGVEIAIIPVRDEPIGVWTQELRLPRGALGEICARGPVVTREYAANGAANERAKIPDGDSVWHRTGDVGYFDEEGLLWFCGRKSHRLETAQGVLMPVPAENVLNRHPRVARTALVGVGPKGNERPTLVVEPIPGAMPRGTLARDQFAGEMTALLSQRLPESLPRAPETLTAVLFKSELPVDARHNAKIRSEELKKWAEEQLA
ncbi:MAG TPA: fatty acid CoA ligase family protein [Planctomycetota bacterium]|nr:fatty acid CoA ligase family protein [Planctomycetota bacterium]